MAVFAPTAAKDAPLEGELVSGLASSQSREESKVSMDYTTTQPTNISPKSVTLHNSILPPPQQSLTQPTPSSASATPQRLLATNSIISHRRNQSHGHISFPKFSMPPNLFLSNSTQDTHFNPMYTAGRCSSVPTTPGAPFVHSNNTSGHTTPGVEKETYTLSDRTSTLVQTTGQIPPPLIGSTSIIHNNHLYLFGGRPQGKDPTNNLYILNMDTLVWTLVDQEQLANDWASSHHEEDERRSSPIVDTVFRRKSRVHPLSIYILPTEKVSTESSKIDVSLSCAIPQPRYYHSAALVTAPPILDTNGSITRWGSEDEAYMVIFGGRCLNKDKSNLHEVCLNDTHILDLKTLQWIPSSLNFSSTMVTGASGQSSSVSLESKSGDSGRGSMEPPCAASEGDFSCLPASVPAQEPASFAKQHNPYQYHTPEPRFAHVASITGDHMVITGGQSLDDDYIHDICVLDLKRHVWMDGGKYQGNVSQSHSSFASVEERPMARRRRRYLECLAAETLQHRPRPLSFVSTISSPPFLSPSHPDAATPSNDLSPLSPTSPVDMISPLLNPRKNSWYRGEGHPFDMPSLPSIRQRIMSDTGLLSAIEPDDYVWVTDEKQDEESESANLQGLVGLGMESDTQRVQEATATAWQPYIAGNTKSPHMTTHSVLSSNRSTMSSGSEKSKGRSQSHILSSSSSMKSHPRTTTSSVPHAVPKAFFAKSNGGMFELEGLAATVARERKASFPKGSDGTSKGTFNLDKAPQLRRCSSNGASSISSRRSSGAVDDNMATRRIRRELESEDKSDKRRSLDSVLDSATLFESFAEEKIGFAESSRSHYIPTPYSQPIYGYSNQVSPDNKLKRDFVKMQTAKGPYRPGTGRVSYEIRPEWTALDLGPGVLYGSESQCPPKMHFPMAHIVDNNFVLSGTSIDDEKEETATSTSSQASKPFDSFVSSTHQSPLNVHTPVASTGRRRSFSVWMHHFHSHRWTQLELSKSLRSGTWNQSVLDHEGNFLYIFGQRKGDPNQESLEMLRLPESLETGLGSSLAVVSFTHMIKVDLEGLEICPAIDEPCVGPRGVWLGLEMLRDGIGADVVLISSVDGGRVRVNSGIVGQRWGYFQALMEERDRIMAMEIEARKSTDTQFAGDSANPSLQSKRSYLSDKPTEILVRESTPILVGFLQYIYTNEVVTPHQLKLKTLQGLLLVSHFYDLTRLQQLVRRAIYQQLNASNAPAICEVAVLTHEFGLQTRALRTLLQSTRMAQMRRQGEDAEAKRRDDFARSRLEQIEEDRKRKASMQANQILLQQIGFTNNLAPIPGYSNSSSDNITSGAPGTNLALRQGSIISNNSGSTASGSGSGSGLGAIGRFFRHREESAESVGTLN